MHRRLLGFSMLAATALAVSATSAFAANWKLITFNNVSGTNIRYIYLYDGDGSLDAEGDVVSNLASGNSIQVWVDLDKGCTRKAVAGLDVQSHWSNGYINICDHSRFAVGFDNILGQ